MSSGDWTQAIYFQGEHFITELALQALKVANVDQSARRIAGMSDLSYSLFSISRRYTDII